MKKITKWLFVAIVLVTSTAMFSQGKLTGVVKDNSGALPGASVVVKGTSVGTTTDFDGKFELNVNVASGTLEVSFLGYTTKSVSFSVSGGTVDLGTITLEADSETLTEVVVTGVIDLATERKTPVAVSTIRAADIQEKLGGQEFPEILNTTPSVYATKQGGGFGDARVNIRGFDQRNTSVLINGVPVNDMENGWVYWSNWAGLSDVTTAMQVQRGLGSSKLAISSVGGTINVVTRTTEKKQGGSFLYTLGTDNYAKQLFSYNTGKLDNGFAASILFSHTNGDGYTDGTEFEGNNYFIGLGYEPNDKNNIQFVFTGAPQWHNQHSREASIKDHIKYNPKNDGEPAFKYNDNWGYLRGKQYTWRRNFYHKPVMSVNWDYKINEKSTFSTIVYGSWGRGGGTGPIGKINGGRDYYGQFRDSETGLLRFDDYVTWNSGGNVPDFGAQRTGDLVNDRSHGFTRRASMNSHNWYGSIFNYENVASENLTYSIGGDLRSYKGIHYRVVNDVLGASDYLDNRDSNNPNRIIGSYVEASPSWNPFQNITKQEKIEYYNDGLVRWAGVFGQVEYSKDKITAFVQASASSQGYKRVEYFKEPPATQATSWKNLTGGNIKGGMNINIDDNNSVFVNGGYYSRQPDFGTVYIHFGNNLNPDLQNEKVFAQEFGYTYRDDKFSLHFNAYNTSWKNRWITKSRLGPDHDGTASFRNVEEVHRGLELDFKYRPSSVFSLNGMVSVGDWQYKNNISADVFTSDQTLVDTVTLHLDGVKVGDAAQFTSSLGFTLKASSTFKWDANWRHAGNLYANLNPTDFLSPGGQALKLPSYDLVNTGFTYTFNTKHQKVFDTLIMRLNINNLFDQHYISRSATNTLATDSSTTWRGVDVRNRVYFGFGRTYNFSFRFKF
ncbi:MAG: TonB-dependent receptor [Flavobacteriaceae bacterium]|nr:TonB-dependent receptor [Flavobacteriaceae bacterium]